MTSFIETKKKFFRAAAIILTIFSVGRIALFALLVTFHSSPNNGFVMYTIGTIVAIVLSVVCWVQFVKAKRGLALRTKHIEEDVYF